MVTIKDSKDIEKVWAVRYRKMLDMALNDVDKKASYSILELGSGRGQMTVPLFQKMKNASITCIDTYSGVYSKSQMKELVEKLKDLNFSDRSRVLRGNALKLDGIGKFDIIYSNELICEFDMPDIRKIFGECRDTLSPEGRMIHSFLSPSRKSEGQRLLMKAESEDYSAGPVFWWKPSDILPILRKVGFKNLQAQEFDLKIKYDYKTALSQLRRWGTKKEFFEGYGDVLKIYGIEMPPMCIIKSST